MVQYVPPGHDDSGNVRIEPPDARLNYRLKYKEAVSNQTDHGNGTGGVLVALGTHGSGISWPKTLS